MCTGYRAEHRCNEAKIIFMLALRRKIIPQTTKTKVKANSTGERIRGTGIERVIIHITLPQYYSPPCYF